MQILILGILLFIVPTLAGVFFTDKTISVKNLPFMWISGQMLLWAGFQCICVPLILSEKNFTVVTKCYNVYTCLLLFCSIIIILFRLRKEKPQLKLVKPDDTRNKYQILAWILFAGLLLLQLVLTIFMAYEEGDDAFYIATSTVTNDADTMYHKLPYTGTYTILDARHGLAPFPIWIAYLARMSGMPAVTTAQIALPLVLIIMAYTIYYLIGRHLLEKRLHLLSLFMVFIAMMILFGGYSVYSAENFLLVRTSQGKAVIANIIIPFLFLLLIMLLGKLQKGEKCRIPIWILLALTMLAGCLCSTLGTLLTCMLLGVVGICAAISYRKWTLIFPVGFCCITPVFFALLYFVLA